MEIWIIFTLLSAILLSVSHIFEKKVLQKEHAMEYGAARGVFLALIAMVLIPFLELVSIPVLLFIYVLSLAIAAGSLFRIKAARHLDISVTNPLLNISPLLVVLLAYFFLGERVTPLQFFGILLLLVGAYIVEVDLKKRDALAPFRIFLRSRHIHYLIFALFVLAFVSTSERFLLVNYIKPLTYVFYVFLFWSINICLLEFYRHGIDEPLDDIRNEFLPLLVCAVALFLSSVFYLNALSLQEISLVMPIKRTSTLFATVIGGFFMVEKNLLLKTVGCVIMIIGAVIVAL